MSRHEKIIKAASQLKADAIPHGDGITKAAGILFRSPNDKFLFLLRSDVGDMGGYWGLPGGKIEGDETPEIAAIREAIEETGFNAGTLDGELCRYVFTGVDFTTFVKDVEDEFRCKLNDEHTSYGWFSADEAQSINLHPGVELALRRPKMDEMEISRAMAHEGLSSPQRVENATFYVMRATGTGFSHRPALDEYVYRDPSVWLTPALQERMSGIPVIWWHPPKATLDSEEHRKRVVGTTGYSWIEGDQINVVARIYDDEANQRLADNTLSTSPTVVFGDPTENTKLKLPDGSTLLIEGKPTYVDHLAICRTGVWDKGGPVEGIRADMVRADSVVKEPEDVPERIPTGTSTSKGVTDMADKDDKPDATKPDARSDTDKIMDAIGSVAKHCDSMQKRWDAWDDEKKKEKEKADAAAADAAKADADKEKADKAAADAAAAADASKPDASKPDASKPDASKPDASKPDASKPDDGDLHLLHKKDAAADAARADATAVELAATKKRLAELEAALPAIKAMIPKQLSDEDFNDMAEIQSKADSVYQGFGKKASRPLDGETKAQYRRRLANGLKEFSPDVKDADLSVIPDGNFFDSIEKRIYADATEAALHPTDLEENEIRAISKRDEAGRNITTFHGKKTFIHQMGRPRQVVSRLGVPQRSH